MAGDDVIRVAIVDDHPSFRDGIAAVLSRHEEFLVVGLGGTREDARAILDGEEPPDVMILDVRLGEENGLSLLTKSSRTAVIMFSAFDYPQYQDMALRCGAAGFVAKSVETRELVDAVKAVAAGRLVFGRRVGDLPPTLSPRERDVVKLVAEGRSNDEIGVALGVTSRTVEAHLGRIFERAGVGSRTELATRAIREAWLDLPPAVQRSETL